MHAIKYYNLPEKALQAELEKLKADNLVERIWKHDHTVWKDSPDEIRDRLGWLQIHRKMTDNLQEISTFAGQLQAEGYNRALLLGMGGSSLAPEVFRKVYSVKAGYLDLEVLDSTDPGAVLETEQKLDYGKTLFIVSTKSGGTVETFSLMKYFFSKALAKLGRDDAGKHFMAITDPGSGLDTTARDLGFRKIFLNDPAIGGRYSALSYFGLVPAGLIGTNLRALLQKATAMEQLAKALSVTTEDNSPAWLGAAIGTCAKLGRDKLTLFFSPAISPFGSWIEQLIAESTGKEGRGILPVDGETLSAPEAYSGDRLFVAVKLAGDQTDDQKIKNLIDSGHPLIMIELQDISELGSEMFRWMMATAVAGWSLQINPFDQPNVEAAKVLARDKIADYQARGKLPEPVPDLLAEGIAVFNGQTSGSLKEVWQQFLAEAIAGEDNAKGRSYISIQAYLKPDTATDRALQKLRDRLMTHCRMAVTSGYGPRFLHSTGQLHKGDAGKGLFIQLTSTAPEDAPIPDEPGSTTSSISFGVLINAQASGDRQALLDAGRKVIRFDFAENPAEAIDRLTKNI